MDTVKERKQAGFRAELPPQILNEIGKRLHSRLDFARFRSVCKTWRSSLPSPTRFPLPVPRPMPPLMIPVEYPGARYFIAEHSFYSVDTESDADQSNRMLVLVKGIGQGGVKFKPLAFLPVADITTKTVKTSQSSSCDSFLSKFYTIRIAVPGERERTFNMVPKIVFIFSNLASLDPNYATKRDVTVVARLFRGALALLRLGDGSYHNPLLLNWETDFCSSVYEDIISYKGKLFTVDILGAAFAMDYHSLQMTQVAAPLFAKPESGRLKMQLVEGLGQLCLLISNPKFDLKVYMLRSKVQQWHEVDDLGEQVFILCKNHCFSIARDVFSDFELMDSEYKSSFHPKSYKLVFSYPSPHLDGTGTSLCVVPIDSIPCVNC